jgi:hypothetical protein
MVAFDADRNERGSDWVKAVWLFLREVVHGFVLVVC